MHLLSKITLFIIILCTKSSTTFTELAEKEKDDVTCFDPVRGESYISKIKFCVYGMRYNAEAGTIGYNEELFINNPNSFDAVNFFMSEFEEVAYPLCLEVEKQQSEGLRNVTLFFGAWIHQKDGRLVDVYIACCNPCLRMNKFQWLRTLMAEYTIRHEFAIKRRTELLYYHGRNYLFRQEFQYQEIVQERKIGACLDSFYRIRPVTLYNYVCFVTAHDRLNYQTVKARTMAEKRKKKTEVVMMGHYNAMSAINFRYTECSNTISTKDKNVCFVFIMNDYTYGFECCCYGRNGAVCQDKVINAIGNGENVNFVLGQRRACAVDWDSQPGVFSWFSSSGVLYIGSVNDFLLTSKKFEFCELHLSSFGKAFSFEKAMKLLNYTYRKALLTASALKKEIRIKNVLATEKKTSYTESNLNEQSKPEEYYTDMKIHNGVNATEADIVTEPTLETNVTHIEEPLSAEINFKRAFKCDDISTWDSRELDILQFRCVELLPIDAQCPFEPPMDSKIYHIKCCCIDHSFCNYEPNLLIKNTTNIPQRCKYSNAYQYFVDAYMYPSEPSWSHTCLVHFANYHMLSNIFGGDMLQNDENSMMRMFTLPGSAFSPVDFSYALLQPGVCRIIDVHLNVPYMLTRHCLNFDTGNSLLLSDFSFLPMRVVACRCNTTDLAEPCDDGIPPINPDSERTHMCAKYEEDRLAFHERKFVTNTASPFCVTYVRMESTSTGISYVVKSNALISTSQFRRIFHVDTLSYIMHAASGEFSSNCLFFGKGVICICHDLDLEPSENVCNEYTQRIRALRLAIHEQTLYSSRRFSKNPFYQFGIRHAPKLCATTLMFATLRIEGEVVLWSECAHKSSEFLSPVSETVFCVEHIVDDECAIHFNHYAEITDEKIVCCCMDCGPINIVISLLYQELSHKLSRGLHIKKS